MHAPAKAAGLVRRLSYTDEDDDDVNDEDDDDDDTDDDDEDDDDHHHHHDDDILGKHTNPTHQPHRSITRRGTTDTDTGHEGGPRTLTQNTKRLPTHQPH